MEDNITSPASKIHDNISFSDFGRFTFVARHFRCTVRAPCRWLTPAHTCGCSHAEQVDGVRLQALQEMFGTVVW